MARPDKTVSWLFYLRAWTGRGTCLQGPHLKVKPSARNSFMRDVVSSNKPSAPLQSPGADGFLFKNSLREDL